jgi:hypothetical protein
MSAMFQGAGSFNQNLYLWHFSNITEKKDMFLNASVLQFIARYRFVGLCGILPNCKEKIVI